MDCIHVFAALCCHHDLVSARLADAINPAFKSREEDEHHFVLLEPGLHGFSRKLAAVIGAEKNGGTSSLDGSGQEQDDLSARMEVATWIPKHSRVNSSKILRVLNCRPSARWSKRISYGDIHQDSLYRSIVASIAS